MCSLDRGDGAVVIEDERLVGGCGDADLGARAASAKADSKLAFWPGLTGSRACSRITGTAFLRIDHIHTPARCPCSQADRQMTRLVDGRSRERRMGSVSRLACIIVLPSDVLTPIVADMSRVESVVCASVNAVVSARAGACGATIPPRDLGDRMWACSN